MSDEEKKSVIVLELMATLTKVVDDLVENSDEKARELSEARGTMIVNYGVESGRILKIVTADQSLMQMIVTVGQYYHSKQDLD